MAFQEVTIDESEYAAGGTYRKFEVIGDKVGGYFVGVRTVMGKYGEKREYTLRVKDAASGTYGDQVITAPADLDKKFQKALAAGLAAGMKVVVSFDATKDTGKPSPMKLFGFKFDPTSPALPAVSPKAPAPAADAPF